MPEDRIMKGLQVIGEVLKGIHTSVKVIFNYIPQLF